MSDEIVISGRNYISSKSAAEITGYAQDYIGQLARGGLIEAQRVGGLWYVFLDSLNSYRTRSAEIRAQPLGATQVHDLESVVSFDGKDYISASRAAKITGYNQDYIGQLARTGKILSRQIGNRWYVDREGLIRHKTEKDSLLAAVQAESVGLKRPEEQRSYQIGVYHVSPQKNRAKEELSSIRGISSGEIQQTLLEEPSFTYITEHKDLLPVMETHTEAPLQVSEDEENGRKTVAIRRITSPTPATRREYYENTTQNTVHYREMPRKGPKIATNAVVALTVIIVLSYGLVSLKQSSTYASALDTSRYAAGAAAAGGRLSNFFESIITKDLVYVRGTRD